MLEILLLAALAGATHTYNVVGIATFHAQGSPGIVNVDGEGGHVTGVGEERDGKVSGTFTVDLKTLTTGMRMRDEHMHTKYLTDDKWPKATLVLKPWAVSPTATPFVGDFTLRGVTKQVAGVASVSHDGKLHAEFPVLMTDYGIEAPSMGPVTVKPEVAVTVEAEVQ